MRPLATKSSEDMWRAHSCVPRHDSSGRGLRPSTKCLHECGRCRAKSAAALLRPVEAERLAQIDALDFNVARQIVRRSRTKNFAGVDDVSAVGDAERLPNVVVRHENAEAIAFEVENDAL